MPGKLWHGDCLELMRRIPDGKVDMIFVDLPYGTTASDWDSVIPLDALWEQYHRICKKNAAMVFTAAQPFTTVLISSNQKEFRYCWYWIKGNKTLFQSAKYQPMRNVEDVCVFYRALPTYNPQGLTRIPASQVKTCERVADSDSPYHGCRDGGSLVGKYRSEWTNYPCQALCFDADPNRVHVNQKPVALIEYLVKTYTDPGQIVLDNTCGSGSTGVACVRTGRKYICMEKDPDIFEIARKRIEEAERMPGFGLA